MPKDQADWEGALMRWAEPFFQAFRHKAQRRWAPLYLRGLLLPGERKSIEPMAERVCPGETQQLHHFVAGSTWDTAPLEAVLLAKVDDLVGGKDAHLIVDDTALVKKGEHSVGVAHQYCGQLGKSANCQALVSLTLAKDEVPVPVALRLFLPEAWANDVDRRKQAAVPESAFYRPKWQIALDEIDRLLEADVTFGDVLADAGYGGCGPFRKGLSERGLTYAVGVLCTQRVYAKSVRMARPENPMGRPRKHGIPSARPRSVQDVIASLGDRAFSSVHWRDGTKGPLECEFAAIRVRAADGAKSAFGRHLPGEEVWLVAERRSRGEIKYYFTNHTAKTDLGTLAAAIKARWSCEQAHQQMKEELGLDHFEGRSWHGLHHHALLTMIAFAFLQFLRLRENKAAA